MKQNWKWVIVGVIAVVIAFGIWRSIKNENKFFNKVELNDNNFIRNKTNLTYLDTVLKVGLDVLELDSIVIFVRPLTIKPDDEITWKARMSSPNYTQRTFKQYLMEINKSYKGDIIGSVSHELIHLKQYYLNKLKITKDYAVWKGDTIFANGIPEYFDRPWESEARKDGAVLEREIRAILYP